MDEFISKNATTKPIHMPTFDEVLDVCVWLNEKRKKEDVEMELMFVTKYMYMLASDWDVDDTIVELMNCLRYRCATEDCLSWITEKE